MSKYRRTNYSTLETGSRFRAEYLYSNGCGRAVSMETRSKSVCVSPRDIGRTQNESELLLKNQSTPPPQFESSEKEKRSEVSVTFPVVCQF